MQRKIFLIALIFLSLNACTRNQNPVESTAVNSQLNQEWQEGSEVFFLLLPNKIIPLEKNPPTGFYVKGIIENRRFKPLSQVLGIGELESSGRYGWLELSSQEFFPMESDRKAEVPFVKGYMTKEGFVPSIRDVIDTP